MQHAEVGGVVHTMPWGPGACVHAGTRCMRGDPLRACVREDPLHACVCGDPLQACMRGPGACACMRAWGPGACVRAWGPVACMRGTRCMRGDPAGMGCVWGPSV